MIFYNVYKEKIEWKIGAKRPESIVIIEKSTKLLSPRFKSFGLSLISFDPGLSLNLESADDRLCHVIDSCQFLGST